METALNFISTARSSNPFTQVYDSRENDNRLPYGFIRGGLQSDQGF
jgi:hypothetical protein